MGIAFGPLIFFAIVGLLAAFGGAIYGLYCLACMLF